MDLQPISYVGLSPSGDDAGRPVTVAHGNEVVIWVFADDDRATTSLASIGREASAFAEQLVIDGSHVTGGSPALIAFIARMSECMPVTVRRPTPLLRQALIHHGLVPSLRIDDGQDRS